MYQEVKSALNQEKMENMPANYAVVTTDTERLTIRNEGKDIARMTANMNTWTLPKKCLQNVLNILDSHVYLKTDNADSCEKVYINPNNKVDDVLLISEYVEFSTLIEPFMKTVTEKNYEGGKTKKFICLFNGKEDGMKLKEYYSCSVLAVSTEGSTEWNLLLDFHRTGSPFGRYPTFHTLTSVGRKKAFQYG